MRFSATLALLASAASFSSAATVPRYTKEESFRDFGVQTEQLKAKGWCRAYPDGEPSYSKWEDQCAPICDDARKIAKDNGEFFSVGCMNFVPEGQHNEMLYDPEQRGFYVGTCKCNVPFANWLAEGVVRSLPAIGQVTCAVLRIASKEAAQLLAAVPGISTAKTGTQVLSKVAKTLKKGGKGMIEWEAWVREHVEKGDACDFSLGQVFEDLSGLDDGFLKNI